uniref:reverse transcriptase domain-containing protein n=1 Tax=Acinetobacter baumannii TaxID=470 RepID=UPI00339881BD
GLFNTTRLRAKTKRTNVLLRELLFADDAAMVSHTEDGLQQLITHLSDACKEFGLAISLKKSNVMVQGFTEPPNLKIDDYTLEPVADFNYLGSTVSNSVSVDVEVNRRIAKAAAVMARLNRRVWKNLNLTMKT